MEASEIGRLYKRFGPVIYRRCLKLLADPELADDATQEVFVRAVRHAERLRNDRECLPWLYRVTTNFCLNLIRDLQKMPLLPLTEASQEPQKSSLETRYAARQEIAALLHRLDDTSAAIAVFAYHDGMTQVEIAEVTGLSRRTVGKRLKLIDSTAALMARPTKEAFA